MSNVFKVSFEGETSKSTGPHLVYRNDKRFVMVEQSDEAEKIAAMGNSHENLIESLSSAMRLLRISGYAMTGTLTTKLQAALDEASKVQA